MENATQEELFKELEKVGRATGVELDEDGLPIIHLSESVGNSLAPQLGAIAARNGLFMKGDILVTIDPETSRPEAMTADCFCSWIESYCHTGKMIGQGKAREFRELTMGKELARKILAAHKFRRALYRIDAVYPVRVPVPNGEGSFELAPAGYHSESRSYTTNDVDYRTDLSIEEARQIIVSYLEQFPWGDLGEGEMAITGNRSAAVQLFAMLSVYCRGMFETGAKRPMMVYIGNQPGTGKSLLAAMAISPVFGAAASIDKPRDEEKLSAALQTIAQTYSPYAFFDDIGGGIFSNSLNRFITSSRHQGRVYGSNTQLFDCPQVTQVFATGNGIELTSDLQRRSLVVELFLPGEVQGRTFTKELSEEVFEQASNRAELLSALYAIVKNWQDRGSQVFTKSLPSFELWSRRISAMVIEAGFADPLAKPKLPSGGDKQGDLWRRFLGKLAGEHARMAGSNEHSFTVKDCLEFANDLAEEGDFELEDLVGSAKDKSRAFGIRIAKWKGRHVTDTQGRVVEFGSRHQKLGRTYPCKVIKPAP